MVYKGHIIEVDMIQSFISEYNIPVVEQHGSVEEPKVFMKYVHELKNAEGFVIRWADGHRVKIKAHEYLQIHKAKEAILQDRNIVELILEEHLDDVKAHLPAEDRDRLTQFENDFNQAVKTVYNNVINTLYGLVAIGMDRKTFALEHSEEYDGYVRSIIFKNFDFVATADVLSKIDSDIRNTIRNNLGRTAKYEAIREVWFPGVFYNEY